MKYIMNTMNQDNHNNGNLASLQQQGKSLSQNNAECWLFATYPIVSEHINPITSLAQAINDDLSLILIDQRYGAYLTIKWIKAQLLDVFRICGAGGIVSSYQVITIARRIRKVYYYLSLSELSYFFEAFIGGSYGSLYVGKTVNPQNIMMALALFDNDRTNRITNMECERSKIYKEEKFKPVNSEFINQICERIKNRLKKTY